MQCGVNNNYNSSSIWLIDAFWKKEFSYFTRQFSSSVTKHYIIHDICMHVLPSLHCRISFSASSKCGGGDSRSKVFLLYFLLLLSGLWYTIQAKRIVCLLISGCSLKPLHSFAFLVWLFIRSGRTCFVWENLAELQFNSIYLFFHTHLHTQPLHLQHFTPPPLTLLQQNNTAEYAAVLTAGTCPGQDSFAVTHSLISHQPFTPQLNRTSPIIFL